MTFAELHALLLEDPGRRVEIHSAVGAMYERCKKLRVAAGFKRCKDLDRAVGNYSTQLCRHFENNTLYSNVSYETLLKYVAFYAQLETK